MLCKNLNINLHEFYFSEYITGKWFARKNNQTLWNIKSLLTVKAMMFGETKQQDAQEHEKTS